MDRSGDRRWQVALAVGLVVGGALGGLVGGLARSAGPADPGETDTRSVAEAAVKREAPADPTAAPAPGPGADCAQQVEPLRREVAHLRAQLALYGGESTGWPEEVPRAFREDELRAWLPHALEASGIPARTLELDCSEFPCIGVFRLDDGVPADSNVVQPLREAFLGHAQGAGEAEIHIFGTEEDGNYAALAFRTTDDLSEALGTRTRVRVQDLLSAHTP